MSAARSRSRRATAATLLLLVAVMVLLAGCGSSGTRKTKTSGTVSATTATSVAPASTTVTGATTTTPLPGTGRPTILLGDMNTPEQFLLGALYYEALRAQGYTVESTRNIGAPQVSLQAVEQGSLDVYPEYLNLWDTAVVGHTKPFGSLAAAYGAGQAYAQAHKLELLAPTPFSDTSGIATLSSYAAANDLHSLADLAGVAPAMTLASPLGFTNDPGGLPTLEHAYGFTPGTIKPVNVGSQYSQLRSGLAQAVYAATTDGQLSEPLYRLLSDPKHVLGFGNVVPVVSQAALAAEGPVFAETIERIDRLLTTTAIRGLNAEVSVFHHDPDLVAREFLQGWGILTPPQWPSATTTAAATTTTPTGTQSGIPTTSRSPATVPVVPATG